MEITTNSKLDLAINKDDLIDIMIDNKMSEIEAKIAIASEQRAELLETLKNNEKLCKELFDKQFLKLLPSGLKPKDVVRIHYYSNCNKTNVTFYFDNFHMVFNDQNTTDNSLFKKEKTIENKKLEEKISKLNIVINDLQTEKVLIEKSPKRLKAQMLKNFLNTSKEGLEVLNLINKSTSSSNLLTAPTKKK